MFSVIIASLGYAGGVVADKIVLSKYRLPVMRFIPLLFIFLAIITLCLVPFYGSISYDALFTLRYMLLFIGMIVVAVLWNIFYYKGIQKEEIHEFELIMLLSPLVTIVFAEIFLPSERNLPVFLAALIASGALIATRFRHHHMTIGKTTWQTILAMVLMSFEAILIKNLLAIVSPVTLYFIRTAIIAIVFVILYRPRLFDVTKQSLGLIVLSAGFGVVQMVLKFYGFSSLGVIETTMILVLGPFLVYTLSYFYFKEQLYKRDLVAALVVIVCILYVTLK